MKSKWILAVLFASTLTSAFAGECRYSVKAGAVSREGRQSNLTVEQCVTEALAEIERYEADHPASSPTTTILHSDLGRKSIVIDYPAK
jgi:hypothetical protein